MSSIIPTSGSAANARSNERLARPDLRQIAAKISIKTGITIPSTVSEMCAIRDAGARLSPPA
jgi:hypothetical protein